MARAPRRSAARAPAAVLQEVEKRVAAGWPAGLTVLAGNDRYHLDLAERSVLAALVPEDATDFGLTVYGEGKVEVAKVVAAARSVGMFSTRRVVLVRDVGVLDGEPEALIDYARSPPDASYILVRAAQLDLRFKLHKALAKHGTLLKFEQGAQDSRSAEQAVKALAKRKKVKLSPAALTWITVAADGDLYRATQELEKLAAWQSGPVGAEDSGEPIGLETVQALVVGNDRLSGWEVSDAILERDRRKALTALRSLLQGGAEPLLLLGGIAWRARVMLEAKALLARRTSPREVISAVRAFQYGDRLIAGLRRYSLEELVRFPDLLRSTDLALKGGLVPDALALEAMVESMTGEGR